jgi:hypothetical protein
MSDCCEKPIAKCIPSTKQEEKCAIVDCEYKKVIVTTTIAADCTQTVVITDGATVLPSDTQLFVCKEPTPVIPVCKPKTVFDREMVKLCHPDGTKVLVQDVTPEDAPLGTAPTLSFWTIAIPSVPYTGDTSQLKDCGAEKIDLTAAEWFCASGVPISRSDAWDVSVSPRALIGSIWQDVSGAVVPAPAAGSYVVGDCSCVSVPQGILVSWG